MTKDLIIRKRSCGGTARPEVLGFGEAMGRDQQYSRFTQNQKQSGVMLLEAMIGILLFSIGILGMVSLQAASMKAGADANYRIEASYLGSQIISQMWADRANLSSYSLNASSAPCAAGANTSSNQNVIGWLNDVSRLPGSGGLQQQIDISPGTNQVQVTVCWLTQKSKNPHNLVVSSSIN